MPYAYAAGDYYRGDYYRGDFLGIGKGLKRLAGNLLGNLPVVGGIARTLIPGLGGVQPQLPTMNIGVPVGGKPEPGIAGSVHRMLPGGHSGYGYYNKHGEFIEGKRPRMNVLNPRALRRAARRAKGFLRFANSLGALPLNRGKGRKVFKRKRR